MGSPRILRGSLLALSLVLAAFAAFAETEKKPAGVFDSQHLIDALGDDRVLVEVTLGPWMLRPLMKSDPELEKAAGGLESITALIFDLSDAGLADRAREEVAAIEKKLLGAGWERIARIREEGAQIKVFVLRAGEEQIGGLTVLVLDTDDEDEPVLIFANLAGLIDLAALEKLGEMVDVPGLSDIEWKE